MNQREIKLSKQFKSETRKAVFAIAVFALSYLLLLSLAVAFIGVCIYCGIVVFALLPHGLTLFIVIGIVSIGILVLYFLIKFIFKWHRMDRSHLIETTMVEQPELFALIHSVANEVNTDLPKRVYLSADLNASVFFDSSFLSLFLPVKKNLMIGLALVNSVTKEELRGIIAHEFGHCSQGAMKVGSYIYFVNQVLFNVLNDNEDQGDMSERWRSLPWFIAFAVPLAYWINKGLQWFLRLFYVEINKTFMGLSREMEFHADEIAASVTGYEPLKNSLLRTGMAEASLENVFSFYSTNRGGGSVRTKNVYINHFAIMQWVSEVNKFRMRNDLPEVSLADHGRYDKTKLVFKDQWASHPSVRERVERLERTGFNAANSQDELATSLFRNLASLQEEFTARMFDTMVYVGKVEFISNERFMEEYKKQASENSFPVMFNGYYDEMNPTTFELEQHEEKGAVDTFNELFSDEKSDWVYHVLSIKNDMEMLKGIADRSFPIKTFDYDGQRYMHQDAAGLARNLKSTLNEFEEKLKQNDVAIYKYFLKLEMDQKRSPQLAHMYKAFFEVADLLENGRKCYFDLTNGLAFVHVETPFHEIRRNLGRLKPLEETMKEVIGGLLDDETIEHELNLELREALEKYLSQSWVYFNDGIYLEDNLRILQEASNGYIYLLSRKYFLEKKKLLTYQEALLQG